ncbi:MAG: hypothetical protein OXC14_17230 [Rhodospirillaceae bacterium]|nr:hypothetical protein [Rhodospirillaceae bacterium]
MYGAKNRDGWSKAGTADDLVRDIVRDFNIPAVAAAQLLKGAFDRAGEFIKADWKPDPALHSVMLQMAILAHSAQVDYQQLSQRFDASMPKLYDATARYFASEHGAESVEERLRSQGIILPANY